MKTKNVFPVIIFLFVSMSVLADRIITMEELKPYLISYSIQRTSGKGVLIRTVYQKAVSQEDVTEGMEFQDEQERQAYLFRFRVETGVDFSLKEDQLTHTLEKLYFSQDKRRRDYADLSETMVNNILENPAVIDSILTNTLLFDGQKVMSYNLIPKSGHDTEGGSVYYIASILPDRNIYFPAFDRYGCIDKDIDLKRLEEGLEGLTIHYSESGHQVHIELEAVAGAVKLKWIFETDKDLLCSYEGLYCRNLLLHESIFEKFTQTPTREWYPQKFTRNKYAPVQGENIVFSSEVIEAIPNSVHFNIPIEDSVFSPQLPVGTEVTDFRQDPPLSYKIESSQ